MNSSSSAYSLSFGKVLSLGIICMLVGFSITFFALEYISKKNVVQADVVKETKMEIEPQVVSVEPQKELVLGDVVHVTFNMPMSSTSEPVSFDGGGVGKWVDPLHYDLTLSDIQAGGSYNLKILSGTASDAGNIIIANKAYNILSAQPAEASLLVKNPEKTFTSPIEISFNTEVDHESAEHSFSILPKAKGILTWENNRMIFTPTRFDYQTTYTAREGSGVIPKRGFPSTATSTLSFTTAAEITKLNVPYFQQQFTNSCEAAALRMALSFYGISVSDMDIVNRFGYNPRAKDQINNIWDDPQKMFVGSIDNINEVSGYGVYGTPVAKAARSFGKTADYRTVISPQFLAEEIRNKHPVLVWGYTSLENPPYTWTTPDGTIVKAFKGEHVRTIVGVEGRASAPIGFYVHDPINGNQFEFWTTEKLMAQINSVPGVTNQAVVIK